MAFSSSPGLPEIGKDIPVLNHSFEVTPEIGRDLWLGGQAMPDPENGRKAPAADRVLQSEDGKWVIHRLNVEKPADEVAASAMYEFDRLQEYGVNVISRGLVSSHDRATVLAITPYISGLTLCPLEVYIAHLARKVSYYFYDPERQGDKKLTDIDRPEQYSLLPEAAELLLHDVHPYMATLES